MIGAVSGGDTSTDVASVYYAQQLQGIKGPGALSSMSSGSSASGSGQSSATISGPGQLLSDLQQLQTQDPAKFKRVVTQIAGQLQAAAQQTQGPQSDFLANLAAKFQNVADGGSLSQLQPQQSAHHHHHHRAQQAYGSQSSQAAPQGLAGLSPSSGSATSGGSTLQQLFSSISAEVSSALSSLGS